MKGPNDVILRTAAKAVVLIILPFRFIFYFNTNLKRGLIGTSLLSCYRSLFLDDIESFE